TEQQLRTLRSAEMRLHKSGEERELITRHLDRYRRLADSGFVGDERRIAWLDGLRMANESIGLFGVDYQISAQHSYARSAELGAPELVLQESVMNLKLRLLHEEDLLRFFSALARQHAGLFLLDQCAIQRLDGGSTLTYRPHLAAECDVLWITAKPAPAEVTR
ncbi:MAG TPA: hypothetical protein VLN59_09080, partial [Burkholderiales bacterium]|nr:hypothetical protein [Burkholderiales bacterium]